MDAAAGSAGNDTKPGNAAALARATGRPWDDWVRALDAAGARDLDHAAIARLALAEMPQGIDNPEWWAQAASIAYEQQAGLRVPGQSSTGTFRVSASRTVGLDRDAAIEAWVAAHGTVAEHLGHRAGEPRPSRTEKRSFWRFGLEGAGRVEVSATPKGEDRVVLAVSQTGLPDGGRIEEWRAHWKALLDGI